MSGALYSVPQILFHPFLLGERLYDLLSGNDFFDEAVQFAQIFLLNFKQRSGPPCNPTHRDHKQRMVVNVIR